MITLYQSVIYCYGSSFPIGLFHSKEEAKQFCRGAVKRYQNAIYWAVQEKRIVGGVVL